MPIQTNTLKNTLATAYGAEADFVALYTTVPGASAGTEVSGGTPAYARKPPTWTAPNTVGPAGAGTQPATNGVIYSQVVFDVPAGTDVRGAGFHTLVSGGTYLDGGAVTLQNFATQGTYTLNLSYTQS